MKIFVTGGTGFIGSAVVHEMVRAGHKVTALARSDEAAAKILAMGAEVHKGDLRDIDSLTHGARLSDGVLHLGFIHDFANFAAVSEIDKQAIIALGEGLKGTQNPLVVTAGIVMISPGKLALETDKAQPSSKEYPRASEETVDKLVDEGINASVVRLSPSVHGPGDYAFIPELIKIAKKSGFSAFPGDGSNRWSAVHRLDAASLFRLAIENPSQGARYHGAAEEGVELKDIARVIAQKLNLPLKSISPEEAMVHFSWLAGFVAMDCQASSAMTRTLLNWKPREDTLLGDLQQSFYY